MRGAGDKAVYMQLLQPESCVNGFNYMKYGMIYRNSVFFWNSLVRILPEAQIEIVASVVASTALPTSKAICFSAQLRGDASVWCAVPPRMG